MDLLSFLVLGGLAIGSLLQFQAWRQLSAHHSTTLTALAALALRVEALEVSVSEVQDIVMPT